MEANLGEPVYLGGGQLGKGRLPVRRPIRGRSYLGLHVHPLDVCTCVLDVRGGGLCPDCLVHSVAGGDKEGDNAGEKEVDTRHSDNDEKKETFEDLPDHLQLGQDFTLRVTVLQAYGVSPDYTDIFTQFK